LDTIKAWVSWATHSDRPGSPIVGLTFELAQRGKRPSIPVSAARPEHTIFSGDKKALDRIRASLQKVDTLDTGEKQARLPGAESARQAGKASTSFKAPQQASGEDFALGPIETPEATARREAAEKPSLFVESAEQTKPSSGQDILAKMKADTAARRARMTELQERFERDGYLYAENPKRPGHTIVLSPSTRQGVKYQVTTFDDGQPTGHRDYNSLGVEKGPLDSALSEFLSWDVKERPTSSTEKIVLPVTPRSESASVEIPSTRPYLTADMKPSEMMRAYVKATWGEFGQQDLIDAVVGATGFKNFVPGKSTRRGDKATLSEQKRNVLKWMDWSDAGIAEHEKSTSALPVTPKASEPDRRPSTIPVTPKNDPKREALIERIVAAARRPEPDIVPVVMTKGTDGKWYRATANSMPQNVRATDEDRIDGYVIRTEQGTTVGTAAPTKEAKLKEWQAVEEKKAADFRTHLQGESDERLQSQASYWLKTGAKPGLAGHDDFIARLRKGEVTPHDLKTAFEQALSDKAKLLEQLSAMTKDELLKRFGRMGAARYKSEKKAAIVDAAYRDILQDFVLANSLSYNPMSKGGFEAAVRAQVENATEADIAAYAQRVTEAIDAHKKRVEGYVKAIKNPETLEEFDTFVRANKNGEAGLTDAQRVTYDELRARAGREVRQRDDAKKATVQAASETVATTITETTHTKKGYPLFVVQLAKRVERDDYTKLNLAAKKLGGWYSSFRGNGATPGFQFKTKDAAEAFQKLATEGDTTAVKEAATERRETRREEKKNAAAERLADMADKLEASAQESLSRDRLANTARRARMAESADASARADLAMARTLRNLAEAIESGEATHLDGIRTKTQIEGLDKIATQAKYDAIRERSPEYRDFEKEKDRAVTAADIDHATYPAVTATRADLLSAATAFKGRRVATRLTALAKRTSGDERIEVPWDVVAEAVAVDEELGKRGVLPWIWASRQTDHRRLETAGIPDLPTLRAALREFVQYRGAKPEADKVKTLERELAGERGVGIDFFPTPEDLALRMAEALDVQKGMTVLEPSAGKGNLADAVRAVNSDAVIHVVEIAPKLRAILEAKGYHIAGQDFTGFAGEQDREERYDRVIMNPPFSNGQDADHVRRAFDLLKPGGRLVAITGEGIFFRGDKKATAFRAWFDEVGGTSEKLEGAFTDRREVKTTGVASRLLVVNKPEAPAKSEKGGSGNVSAESFRSPTRRPFTEPPRSPIPVTARKPVRPSDLVKRVSDLFGKLPIKTKRFRERAFGIYKKKEQVVRLKVENDLATLSHELGHHVDLAIFGNDLPYDLYRDELLRLGANTSRGRDSAETKLREGAAEFFRLYVSDPNGARRQAPTYYRAFTDALAKSEWADAIKETQKLFRDYLGQDLATRGEARIDFTGGQPDTLFKQIASDPRGFVDRMATAWVDDLRAAQRVVEALEKDSGEPIDALESAYVLARLARGAAGKAEGFLHYGPRSKDGTFLSGSLHDALEPVAKRLEDFSRFLVALRVVELRGRGIETGISFPEAKAILDRSVAPGYVPAVAALEATRAGEKTGLTLEQAEAAVQSHIKTGFKEFEKARVAVYAYQDAVLRYARELGALSGDQIKAIRAVNRFYVPFQRVLEATESGLTGTAKRLADRALPVKRIRGSGKDIINPLESIIKNTFATVDMVEKNRAMLALVDQAMEIKGSGRFIEHIPAPQVATQFNLSQVAGAIKKALEEEGVDLSEVLPNGGQLELDELVTVFTPAQFAGKGSGIVSVIRNGKREWYSVNDKDLYDAITAVGPQIAGWVKALSGPASWLRAGATLTLGFVARNPVRDTFVAAVQSKHGFVPVVDTVRGLFSYLKADNYYQDFLNSGAANSALVSRDRDQIRTALRKMVDRKWIPRNPIEILRALSEATEMATRVGEFRRGVLHEGRTPEGKARAALGARDVTMDFARAGSVGRQVNQFAAFFNARVQGYSRMVDLAKEDAHRARTEKDPNPFHYASGRAAIYLALFSALVWKLNQDDRDYEEIPDWEKATYWHIPIPGGWIRVPKPFEWGTIFGSTTEAALNYLKTKDPQKLRNLFPDGPGPTLRAAALSIMPVAIMPWVEIWSNYDMFRDRNIVSPYDTDLPPELQYSRWTSTTAKTIGNVMGVSPSKIDHIAYGYFAGLGRAAMEAPSVLTRLSGQSSAPAGGASDLPVVGTFFRPRALSAQATSLQDLYDFSERLSGAKRGMELYAKRGDYEQVKEIRQTLGPIVAGRPSLDVAARSINEGVRELKELRPQIDAIFASKTLTPQQKREQLDRVYEAMVQTARMALGRPPLERRQTAGAGR
jgi:predicted RNA methylase